MEKEGERASKVDNLKTKSKRQHSGTFIYKTSMNDTKTVRELVDRYEGWGEESGTSGTAKEPFRFGQKSLQNMGDCLMESPRKRMRLAVPGTMGLLETRGTPPGQAIRRKRSSWTPSASSSSPRTVQTPRRGPGQRRLRAGLCTATTATSVHSTPPWMASRWPGGQGTLGGTAPEAKSYSRESCPLFEIKRKVQAVDGGQAVQGVPRQVHHHVEVDGGQAVQGVPQQVHHHQEGSQRSCHQHRPEQGAGNSAAKHQWTPSPSADPEREIKCLEKSDSFDNVLSGRLEREEKRRR
jgi:hypothetical protein